MDPVSIMLAALAAGAAAAAKDTASQPLRCLHWTEALIQRHLANKPQAEIASLSRENEDTWKSHFRSH